MKRQDNKKLWLVYLIMTLILITWMGGIEVSAKTTTKKVTIQTGQKKKISIKVSKKLKVKSSKKSVAAVKTIGKKAIRITGKKAGKAVITVKVTNKKKKTTTIKYKVTVKKKSSKKTNSDNDTQPEQPNEPTTEETKPTPKYTYELKVMNSADKNLYNDTAVIIYVKTNNPNPNTISADCGTKRTVKHEDEKGVYYTSEDEFHEIISPKAYADVNYTDDNNAVSGGYLFIYEWDTPGKKNFTIREKVGEVWVDAAQMGIELKDKEQAEHEWIQAVMAEVTDETMTDKEKMDSLMQYILDNFKYDRNNEQGPISLLKDEGAYWERKYIDCWDATNIMSLFAEQLGLESRATYAGYGVHYYATVTIDGKDYDFDACPMSETGWTTEWEYIL